MCFLKSAVLLTVLSFASCRQPLLRHVAPSPSPPLWEHAVSEPGDPRGAGAGGGSCVMPSVSWTDVCEFGFILNLKGCK